MSGTGAILTRFHSAKCSLPLLAAIIMFAVLIVLTQMDEVEKDVVKEKNKHKPSSNQRHLQNLAKREAQVKCPEPDKGWQKRALHYKRIVDELLRENQLLQTTFNDTLNHLKKCYKKAKSNWKTTAPTPTDAEKIRLVDHEKPRDVRSVATDASSRVKSSSKVPNRKPSVGDVNVASQHGADERLRHVVDSQRLNDTSPAGSRADETGRGSEQKMTSLETTKHPPQPGEEKDSVKHQVQPMNNPSSVEVVEARVVLNEASLVAMDNSRTQNTSSHPRRQSSVASGVSPTSLPKAPEEFRRRSNTSDAGEESGKIREDVDEAGSDAKVRETSHPHKNYSEKLVETGKSLDVNPSSTNADSNPTKPTNDLLVESSNNRSSATTKFKLSFQASLTEIGKHGSVGGRRKSMGGKTFDVSDEPMVHTSFDSTPPPLSKTAVTEKLRTEIVGKNVDRSEEESDEVKRSEEESDEMRRSQEVKLDVKAAAVDEKEVVFGGIESGGPRKLINGVKSFTKTSYSGKEANGGS